MARITVGATAVIGPDGTILSAAGTSGVLYRTLAGATQITDVLDASDAVISGGIVTATGDGLCPLVKPEVGAEQHCFVSFGGGPRQVLHALDMNGGALDTAVRLVSTGVGTGDRARSHLLRGLDAAYGAQGRIVVLGDSKAEGLLATTTSLSWVSLLRDKLRARWPGDAGFGYVPAVYAHEWITPQPTRSAGCTDVLNDGGLGNRAVSIPAGETVTFPATWCSAIDVHYTETDFFGQFGEVLVDGGLVGEFNSSAAAKTSGHVVSFTLTPGSHVVSVRGKAGYLGGGYLEGITFRTASTGVTVYNGAHSGYRSDILANGLDENPSSEDRNLEAVAAINPHLVIVALGANDQASLAADQFAGNLRILVDRLAAVCPLAGFLILVGTQRLEDRVTDPGRIDAFQRATSIEFRDAARVSVAFESAVWRPDTGVDPDPLDFTDGSVHPSDLGHRRLAEYVAGLLLPPGEPAAAAPLVATKTADQSVTSSAALVNATGLSVPVAANTAYELTGYLAYQASTAGDIKLGWTAPAGASMLWIADALTTSASGGVAAVGRTALAVGDTQGGAGVGAGDIVAAPRGILRTGATAGTLQLQFAQLASDGTATILRAGSTILLRRVGA